MRRSSCRRLALLAGVAIAASATPAAAAITFQFGTGNPATNSQFLHIDSNSCATAGPKAAYVGGRITNTGGTTETNIVASMSGLSPAIYLTGGQPASQSLGALAPGESIGVYWYVGFNCADGATATPTVSFASSSGTVNTSLNLAISTAISANAGGLIQSSTLGAGAIVGQTITMDVEYSFGGASAGDEYFFQPSGSQSFRADCFRMTGSQITASAVTAVPSGTFNDLHYVATTSQTGTDKRATVRYFFQYLCASTVTTADPYAAQTSGTKYKYSGNYGATPVSYPGATNPLTITKTVSPTSGVPGSTGNLTYTVTIANPSSFSTIIDSITDQMPAGMTFAGLVAGGSVTAANSSSIPAAGATGTLVFRGKLGSSYVLAAGGSVQLIYTATRPAAAGSYVNTAYGTVGQTNTGTGTSTFMIANAIAAANDSASGIVGSTGGNDVVNVLTNDTLSGVAVSTSTVAASIITPATPISGGPVPVLDPATGFVDVPAGTPAGSYSITYRICEIANTANCATATANITVVPPPIAANPDSATGIDGVAGASSVVNVLGNDALAGSVPTTANVTISVTSAASHPGVTLAVGTGAVNVAAGTPAGTYTIGYQICETTNPASCATSVATVTVRPSVDLTIVKSNGVSTVAPGSSVTYSVVVTNTGPDPVTGAVVTDVVGTGLTCPGTNGVTITGSGVPAGSFTISSLTGSGITLGTLNSGQSATLTYSCQVN